MIDDERAMFCLFHQQCINIKNRFMWHKMRIEQQYGYFLLLIYMIGWILFYNNPVELLILGYSIYYVFKINSKNKMSKIYLSFYCILVIFTILNLLSSIHINKKIIDGYYKFYEEDFMIIEEPEKRRRIHDQLQVKPISFHDEGYYDVYCYSFKQNNLVCPRHAYGEMIRLKFIRAETSIFYKIFNQKDREIYYKIIYKYNIIDREKNLNMIFSKEYKNQSHFFYYILFYIFLFSLFLYNIYSNRK